MWPFDLLKRRRWEREVKAALLLLLGTHLYDRLDARQKAAVDEDVDDILYRWGDFPRMRRLRDGELGSVLRAYAMSRLGATPASPELAWAELLSPWKWPWPWDPPLQDLRPFQILEAYRPLGESTLRAKQYLRGLGYDIPAVDAPDPWSLAQLLGTKDYPGAAERREEWIRKRNMEP